MEWCAFVFIQLESPRLHIGWFPYETFAPTPYKFRLIREQIGYVFELELTIFNEENCNPTSQVTHTHTTEWLQRIPLHANPAVIRNTYYVDASRYQFTSANRAEQTFEVLSRLSLRNLISFYNYILWNHKISVIFSIGNIKLSYRVEVFQNKIDRDGSFQFNFERWLRCLWSRCLLNAIFALLL